MPKFESHKFRWIEIILFIFLVHAPWYSAESLGRRNIGVVYFGFSTAGGLYNLVWIALIGTSLFFLNSRLWQQRSLTKLEGAVLAYGLLNFLNIRFPVTKEYLIGIENAYFLTALLLTLVNARELSPYFVNFRRFAFPIFLISYIPAMLLPIFFPLMEPISGFVFYGHVLRFVGWLGMASYVGFLSLAATMGAMLLYICHFEKLSRPWRIFLVAIAIFGLLGDYIAVHRIAVLAAGAFLLALYSIAKNVTGRRHKLLLAMQIFVLLLFFTGKLGAKHEFLGNLRSYMSKTGFTYAEAMKELDTLSMIEMMVQTNGRTYMAKDLLNHFASSRWFGAGTGAAANFIGGSDHPFGGQPHSDYLRILVDFGVVGLILFLALGVGLALRLKNSYQFAVLMAVAVCLATDNLLVYPTCGYGPLLLMGLLGVTPQKSLS